VDPGDGSAPGPDPLPDFAGPTLRLHFAERGWLGRLRRQGRLAVRVEVDEPATVALTLFRARQPVARARVELNRAGTRRTELRLRRSPWRWLRQARAPRLRFSVVAIDAAKNDTAWSRLLTPALRR
jgi:hypothetical protein